MEVDKVADIVADKKIKFADMKLDMVADMKVDKVANMVANMVADINMEIQFGERVGHGGWLIRPKLFQPEACPACAFSKLCEFIFSL